MYLPLVSSSLSLSLSKLCSLCVLLLSSNLCSWEVLTLSLSEMIKESEIFAFRAWREGVRPYSLKLKRIEVWFGCYCLKVPSRLQHKPLWWCKIFRIGVNLSHDDLIGIWDKWNRDNALCVLWLGRAVGYGSTVHLYIICIEIFWCWFVCCVGKSYSIKQHIILFD